MSHGDSFTKSACRISQITIAYRGHPYSGCDKWRAVTLKKILKLKPELVITSSSNSATVYGGGDTAAAWGKGQAQTYRTLQQGGTKVLTLLDTPWPKNNAVDCAAKYPNKLSACG